MFNEIKPINLCGCNIARTLPLAFDESLSYLEMLCGILSKLNETIIQVNKNTDVVENIDVNFTEIYNQIADLRQEFNQTVIDINKSVDEKLVNQYNQIVSLINDTSISLRGYVDSNINNVNERIDNIELGNIMAFDPTTGKYENINTVINNLYEILRTDAITVSEFDALELTTEEFDNKELTAYGFDINGKSLLAN